MDTPPLSAAPSDADAAAFDHAFQDPPKWPTVVGTISIVWGGLSLTCAGCGVASMLFSPQMMKMAEAELGPAPAVMLPTMPQLILSGLGVPWAILLIVAGIFTVTRSPAGRASHLVWAVGSLLIGLLYAVLAVQQQLAIADWAAQNPDNQWAQHNNPLVAYVSLAVGLVLSFAWPVFCLIWFGLVKHRPEDMTGGVTPE